MRSFFLLFSISLIFGALRLTLPASGEINRADIPMNLCYIALGAFVFWSCQFIPEYGPGAFLEASLLLACILVAFGMTPEQSFKSVAHGWIGFVIGSCIWPLSMLWLARWSRIVLAVGLIVLEVLAFLHSTGKI